MVPTIQNSNGMVDHHKKSTIENFLWYGTIPFTNGMVGTIWYFTIPFTLQKNFKIFKIFQKNFKKKLYGMVKYHLVPTIPLVNGMVPYHKRKFPNGMVNYHTIDHWYGMVPLFTIP